MHLINELIEKSHPFKSLKEPFNIQLFLSPIGAMIAIGDNKNLWLLEFIERKNLKNEVLSLCKKQRRTLVEKPSPPLDSIKSELKTYFEKGLKEFKTPFQTDGTPFQKLVWNALTQIPYAKTLSYAELAKAIKKPTACRAVARGNSANKLALIIPCHRVIQSNGFIGGYAGGTERKQWILHHEKTV